MLKKASKEMNKPSDSRASESQQGSRFGVKYTLQGSASAYAKAIRS